jgi:serine/threonine protein kinase
MTVLTKLQTSTPVAFGGFSELHIIDGYAVKLLEDGCYLDVLEECVLQKQAADAGLAPQVHAVFKRGNDPAVVMDVIDTTNAVHPDGGEDDGAPCLMGELNQNEMVRTAKLYARLILAGILHCDFHAGNIFLGKDGNDFAIDFGIASEIHDAPLKHLNRAIMFLLPVVERLDMITEHNQLMDAYNNADDARALLPQVAKSLLAF